MLNAISVSQLPDRPGIYALCGGRKQSLYVVYVGAANSIKQRITQHLVRRDSSVVTGVAAASLNPELITEVRWWENALFEDRVYLEAAELIAFDIFMPVLRSRGKVQDASRKLVDDEKYRNTMNDLFRCEASGRLCILTLQDALERIETLEQQMATVLRRLQEQ